MSVDVSILENVAKENDFKKIIALISNDNNNNKIIFSRDKFFMNASNFMFAIENQ